MSLPRLPRVNYIGNKERLAPWIVDSFPIKSGRVLDLFAGGSSISYEAKKRGFEVLSNDALYSSFVVNKALIENNEVRLSEKKVLKYELVGNSDFRESVRWLDNTLYYPVEVDELSKLVYHSLQMRGYGKYILQALIRRAMIRKLPYSRMNIDWNNILKLRDETYSYEKYGRRRAYHNKPFIEHILTDLNSYNSAVFSNGGENKVYQLDAIKAIKKIGNVDLVYVDPPYPGTMNNYEEFYGAYDRLFGKQVHYTDITNSNNFLRYFEKLTELASLNSKFLVMSLNNSSLHIFETMIDMFNFYGEVEIKEKKHNYQISGKKAKNNNYEKLAIIKFYR